MLCRSFFEWFVTERVVFLKAFCSMVVNMRFVVWIGLFNCCLVCNWGDFFFF